MYPRDFLREFGHLTFRGGISLVLAPGESFRLLPNIDRYLLNLWCRSGAADIWWDSSAETTTPAHWQMIAGSEKTITHALHGVWANVGVTIQSTALGSEFVILEAFQIPPGESRVKTKVNQPDPVGVVVGGRNGTRRRRR